MPPHTRLKPGASSHTLTRLPPPPPPPPLLLLLLSSSCSPPPALLLYSPSPPHFSPQHGLNIMSFCKDFNAKTADFIADVPIPVGRCSLTRINSSVDKRLGSALEALLLCAWSTWYRHSLTCASPSQLACFVSRPICVSTSLSPGDTPLPHDQAHTSINVMNRLHDWAFNCNLRLYIPVVLTAYKDKSFDWQGGAGWT